MSLPNGFVAIDHIFGVDNYRLISRSPFREQWNQYFWNDSPKDLNWPVFIEGVIVPKSQAPKNWRIMGGLIDRFPRRVYYGGPITRSLAQDYRRSFEQWAVERGYAYETAIIPVQPNVKGMRHPSTNFTWYIADEVRPPTRYRYVRYYNTPNFRWIDLGYDTMKYSDFYRQNPNVV